MHAIAKAHKGRLLQQVTGAFWCMSINEESPDKSIKNKHSKRLVPLTDGSFWVRPESVLQAVEDGCIPSTSTTCSARKAGLLRIMSGRFLART